MGPLSFIGDQELREKVRNSIDYSYALWEISKGEENNDIFKQETHRVIILYMISCIEAILLYFYQLWGENPEKIEYKYVHALPGDFIHKGKTSDNLVVAVQCRTRADKSYLGLHDLVQLFKVKKWMKKETADKIMELNELRNTHHLSKKRARECETSDVDCAFELLEQILKSAEKLSKSE